MPKKQNAPGHKAEGAVCLLAGDTDVYGTSEARVQYLGRLGIVGAYPILRRHFGWPVEVRS